MQNNRENLVTPVSLITSHELANAMGYKSVCDGFRAWCREVGIAPVPGRKSHFDPKLVRLRLDEIQGLIETPANQNYPEEKGLSLVEQRRARRAAH